MISNLYKCDILYVINTEQGSELHWLLNSEDGALSPSVDLFMFCVYELVHCKYFIYTI